MAITKIHKIRSTLSKALSYVMNEAKTDNGTLISTYECSEDFADKEFAVVSNLNSPLSYKKRQCFMNGHDIKAYHLIQSFDPKDNLSPQKAHEIGYKFAMEYTGGEHQFVVATHLDRGHIHNHILFNSTNFMTYRKFHLGQKEMHLREIISDRLCKENGLSVIEAKSGTRSRKANEYDAHKAGTSWKDKLRETIDRVILESDDFDEFLMKMEVEEGYEIKQGKYIAFRYDRGENTQERFTRSKRLGENYSEAAIILRIENKEKDRTNTFKDPGTLKTVIMTKRIYLISPIEKRISALREQSKVSESYETKLIIEEINTLVSSFNFLKERNLLYDLDIKERYKELTEKTRAIGKESERVSENLSILVTKRRYLKNYQESKDDARRFSKNFKEGFDEESYRNKILYDAAVQYFKVQREDPRTIDAQALSDHIEELKAEYKSIMSDYDKANDEKKKLFIVSQNLSRTLGITPIEQYAFKNQQEGVWGHQPPTSILSDLVQGREEKNT